jgi:hypothetical protein
LRRFVGRDKLCEMGRVPARRSTWCAILLVGVAAATGCDDGDDGGDDAESAVAVSTACDRLEDLADAVLASQDVETHEGFVEIVAAPLSAFVDAASASGDDELAAQAATYRASLERFAASTGIDAREAANEADIALDRAGLRCLELGATNSFPQQPQTT